MNDTNSLEIDEVLKQILATGIVPNLEETTQCQISSSMDSVLMMIDRLDLLHVMVARQLSTIETGYVRATCSKELC